MALEPKITPLSRILGVGGKSGVFGRKSGVRVSKLSGNTVSSNYLATLVGYQQNKILGNKSVLIFFFKIMDSLRKLFKRLRFWRSSRYKVIPADGDSKKDEKPQVLTNIGNDNQNQITTAAIVEQNIRSFVSIKSSCQTSQHPHLKTL